MEYRCRWLGRAGRSQRGLRNKELPLACTADVPRWRRHAIGGRLVASHTQVPAKQTPRICCHRPCVATLLCGSGFRSQTDWLLVPVRCGGVGRASDFAVNIVCFSCLSVSVVDQLGFRTFHVVQRKMQARLRLHRVGSARICTTLLLFG